MVLPNILAWSALAPLALLAAPQGSPTPVPSAKSHGCISDLAKLVGGHWEGNLGTAKVQHRYESLLGGESIHDTGTVSVGDKVVLHIDARYGWDPTQQLTYYLDVHNSDTVYFGHVVNAAGTFKLHFINLCNPSDDESSSFKFTDDNTIEFSVGGSKGVLHRLPDTPSK